MFDISALDMQNESMPPRKDASEGASPVDGPKTNNNHGFSSWVTGRACTVQSCSTDCWGWGQFELGPATAATNNNIALHMFSPIPINRLWLWKR